jgi:hypothetical protein
MATPILISAQQQEQGTPMGPGMGMMHGMGPGMGMNPCMGMMGGGTPPKLSDADRGDILVLQGQMLLKKAELMKKKANALIAEGESLRKGSDK